MYAGLKAKYIRDFSEIALSQELKDKRRGLCPTRDNNKPISKNI